jgi:hypothetical protein
MPQATLLSNISREFTGTPIRLFSPVSITLQFTPRLDGFSAYVSVEVAMAQNVTPGYLWYSIPTIGLDPWFPAADLEFSGHTATLAFSLHLNPGIEWIRASVVKHSRGTVSAYIAH